MLPAPARRGLRSRSRASITPIHGSNGYEKYTQNGPASYTWRACSTTHSGPVVPVVLAAGQLGIEEIVAEHDRRAEGETGAPPRNCAPASTTMLAPIAQMTCRPT